MKTLIIISAICLYGCAISADRARMMSDYDLCRKYSAPLVSSDSKYIIQGELSKRGTDCSAYWQMQSIQMQQYIELMNTGNKLMQPQYIPIQQPSSIDLRCTTIQDMYGNYHTNCR